MQLTPVRTTLAPGDQARVYPRRGEVHIDHDVPEHAVPAILAEAARHLVGAPTRYVVAESARPRLALVPGGGTAFRGPRARLSLVDALDAS